MKKIAALLIMATAIAGCSGKHLTDKEFNIIWQAYLQKEFEENFDGKQSAVQKDKILSGILSGSGFSLDEVKMYMKEKHQDKYNKLFVE